MSFRCYHHLSRAAWQSYKFTSLVYKKLTVIAHSRLLKEAMAPRTVGELTGGMAHDGHIHHKNYEFTSIKGPAPATARGYDPDLCHRDPRHVAHSEHTLGTASGGSILEFTYPEGPVPSHITGRGQVSRPGNQRSTARNELTRGMASTSHILLGT